MAGRNTVHGGSGDGGPATAALLYEPCDVAVDTFGNVYIADGQNYKIRKIDVATGIITTIAGNGTLGFAGDGGAAATATLGSPSGLCFDQNGNLYFADNNNSRVRKIDPFGIITTYAGNGLMGSTGDGGPATAGKVSAYSVRADKKNNLYIAEEGVGLNTIRKVDALGIITTIAGDTSSGIYNGDNIPATAATLDPIYLAFDDTGKLYISDNYNDRIRVIDTFGIIHTIAGNGVEAHTGDGGLADTAEVGYPTGLAFDLCGNLDIGEDVIVSRIRQILFYPSCSTSPSLGTNTAIKDQISIYPNPVYDLLQIDNITTPTNYNLHNIVGATLQHGTLKEGSNSISLSALPTGMCLLELIDDEGNRVVRKVVKE